MKQPATTATMGIYCKQCGYNLQGSKEAKRCPECGRGFSPNHPKSFRKHPFAAPWKRALGRWAKRGAILLLVLAILLGGLWGWLYWGWKQEQAALHALGVTNFYMGPLGGETGESPPRWMGPAGFVLLRVHRVFMPGSTTDADLILLRKLPHVWEIDLEYTQITDAGMVHLRVCRNLKKILLPETKVTGAGLVHLRDLPKLQSLHLGQTATNADLACVAEFKHLRFLTFGGEHVTDAGLVHLEQLKELRSVFMLRTKATREGIRRLKAALPGTEINGP